MASLKIKNVGSWYVTAIGYAEPNGCTGRMWLGPGIIEPAKETTIKLSPNEIFSFQAVSKRGSAGAGTYITEYCENVGGSLRFTPKENGQYEMIIGMLLEEKQCIYSFKEITPSGKIDIASLEKNEVVVPQFSTSPMCKKFM
ncbi:hypothetical protein [Rheinheimera sp.]|uniref:hypothetical protein n=1 Tax=Rheinheimera sp. TaxID=1869214 RepID=UPI0023576621|nr:hypothetical protein [Rheinheimera sp.]